MNLVGCAEKLRTASASDAADMSAGKQEYLKLLECCRNGRLELLRNIHTATAFAAQQLKHCPPTMIVRRFSRWCHLPGPMKLAQSSHIIPLLSELTATTVNNSFLDWFRASFLVNRRCSPQVNISSRESTSNRIIRRRGNCPRGYSQETATADHTLWLRSGCDYADAE